MFTLEEIKKAHSKVKSGSDFPAYIQEIKKLGVTYYEVFVNDGRSEYYGASNYKISGEARYKKMAVSENINTEEFKKGLREHQEGKTDYITFINMCAAFGIEKWTVCMDSMICTYYDKSGRSILLEEIPQ